MNASREIWIDRVKLIACILVATGHFYQGIVSAGIVPENGLYHWFNQTIYTFHVPLFFICSGYLHQKYAKIDSIVGWGRNLLKKGITLGIPYFIFSTASWLIKEIFSGSVNGGNTGFLSTLFVTPSAPYWYLYVLFFVFAVTPVFSGRKMAVCVVLTAAVLKAIRLCIGETDIYILTKLMEYEIWFVLGMCLAMRNPAEVLREKRWRAAGVGSLAVFLAGSILISNCNITNDFVSFLEGLIGCFCVIVLVINWNPRGMWEKLLRFLSGYTMPVYLMHTIFAAGIRIVLMKVGILNPAVHIVLGLAISFAGPLIAAEIMKRLKLDILLYPGRYIKLAKGKPYHR